MSTHVSCRAFLNVITYTMINFARRKRFVVKMIQRVFFSRPSLETPRSSAVVGNTTKRKKFLIYFQFLAFISFIVSTRRFFFANIKLTLYKVLLCLKILVFTRFCRILNFLVFLVWIWNLFNVYRSNTLSLWVRHELEISKEKQNWRRIDGNYFANIKRLYFRGVHCGGKYVRIDRCAYG